MCVCLTCSRFLIARQNILYGKSFGQLAVYNYRTLGVTVHFFSNVYTIALGTYCSVHLPHCFSPNGIKYRLEIDEVEMQVEIVFFCFLHNGSIKKSTTSLKNIKNKRYFSCNEMMLSEVVT